MKTKFRKFLAYLLVLMLICSDLAVPVFAEELANPEATAAPDLGPTVVVPPASEPVAPAPVSTLTLPAALKIIEEEAFCGNTSISRVVVPEGATTIEARAFADSSLTEIVLSSTLTSIAESAFDGCGEFAVSAPEDSYAYNWAVEKGYIVPSSATPAEYFETELLDDGTLSITGYTGMDADVVIPQKINERHVTSIGFEAFTDCSTVTQVTLPDGLSCIDSYAFYRCSNLRQINIPSSVYSIGADVFAKCTNLESISVSASNTSFASSDGLLLSKDLSVLYCYPAGNGHTSAAIPSSVQIIARSAFDSCNTLESIVLPGSVRFIGYFAFADCTSLKSITFLSGLDEIGGSAFENCSALTAVTLPDGLTKIADSLFQSCSNLSEVIIPDSVTTIEPWAFSNCTGLSSITLPNSITSIEEVAFIGCSNLESITLSNSLQSIGDSAFEGCNNLESISFPDSLEKLGAFVFKGCLSLKEVILPNSLTNIGECAFYESDSLERIVFSASMTTISDHMFVRCSSLKEVVIPEGISSIGDSAFSQCSSLKTITLPQSLLSINETAFAWCTTLEELIIPESVTFIGSQAFMNCPNLTVGVYSGSYAEEYCISNRIPYEVIAPVTPADCFTTETLADGTLAITGYSGTDADIVIPAEIGGVKVTKIGDNAFADNEIIRHVTIPEGVTAIGAYAFNFSTLTGVDLPGTLTTLGYGAFCSSTYLTEVEVPASVTELSDQCFASCSSLTTVTLPDTLTAIRPDAFFNCPELAELIIPASVAAISASAFEECGAVLKCYSGSFAHSWLTENAEDCGLTYEVIQTSSPAGDFTTKTLDDGTLAITAYNGYDADVVIPAQIGGVQVTMIGERAFRDNSRITSVVIPEGVTSIGKSAFSWAEKMTSIQLPSTLKTIGESAFNWSGLTSVTLPEGLTSIGESAFNANKKLTQITLPASLTDIGSYAFWQCSKLSSFSVAAGSSAYQAIDGVLFTADGVRLVAYPVGSESDSYTVPAGVTVIGNASFRGSRLTSVILPEGVTAIENWAFGDGASLTSVDLPASLSSIGDYAFNSCDKMAAFNVAAGNSVYESIDGVLFSKEDSTLLFYPLASSRTSYTVPDGTKAIADDAFSDSSLVSVTLPESLESIGDHAFVRNHSLTGIHIPANVSSIMTGAFRDCLSLTGITVSEENTAFKSVDGVLFSKDGTVLLSYPSGKTASSYTVPDGVLEIGPLAFIEVDNLTSVTLPEGLTTIGDASFNMCHSLASINIPESVTFIDTFYSCDELVAIVVEGSYGEQWCRENGVACDAGGDIVLIESEHPYPNSADQYWEYAYPEEAFALAVTFSSITQFEDDWDFLTITAADGSENRYTGEALAGKTVAVPGDSFTLHLTSDESVSMYGFRITKIEALTEEEYEDYIGFQTELLNNGTLSITGYNGPETSLEIPAEIDGTPVTAISEGAFRSSSLSSIVIPEGVTYIGSSAFGYCDSLTDVTLPQSLRAIDQRAFEECESLVSIVLPDGLTSLGRGAFEWCYSLESVNIPSGLTTIPASAFIGCSELTELVIPEGIKTIEEYAFSECSALTGVSLPASLTSIGSNAFRYVDRMIVTAPEGSYAWQWAYDNNYLDIAVIESDHPYEAGVTETWEYTAQKENIYALAVSFSRKTRLEEEDSLTIIDAEGAETEYTYSELAGEIVVLSGTSFSLRLNSLTGGQYGFAVTKIEELTEEDYNSYGGFTYEEWDDGTICLTGYTGLLADLEIPAEIDGCSVAAIGYECFINNPRLVSVVIPEGVTDISESAFSECENLTSVSLPSTLTYIGDHAFRECRSLTAIDLPEDLRDLSYGAFKQCDSLTEVTIPGSLTEIPDDAFYGCDELTSVTVSEGVRTIIGWAFSDCLKLETVNLPASVTEIGEDALNGSYMATVYAPEGSYAWQWAEEYDFLPETALIESAHPYAPDTNQTWEYSADSEDVCGLIVTFSRKTAFNFGDSLTIADALGGQTVYTWYNLRSKTIVLPGSSFTLTLNSDGENENFGFMVTSIVPMNEEEFLSYGEFTHFTQSDGTLCVTGYTGFNPNLVIPSEIDGAAVTTIGGNAFVGNRYLETVVIPGSVTLIRNSAFERCPNLTEATLSEGTAELGYYSFANCPALKTVSLPASLTAIDSFAFSNSANVAISASEGSYAYQWADERGMLVEIPIIESGHPYAADADLVWEYVHPEEVYGLAVTFGSETELEYGCDYLTITDAAGSEIRYTGAALAKQKLALKGNSFTLRLTSDADGSYYGFAVVRIKPLTEETFPTTDVFTTSTLSDGTLRITGYSGDSRNVVIPAQIDGMQVTEIGYNAFSNQNLTSVVIPEGVTRIDNYAFNDNPSLGRVSLPSTLKYLGVGAFIQCGLSEISLPEGLISIGDQAFGGNRGITSVHIPASVTGFGEGVFNGCYDLDSFTIAEGNTAIKVVDDILFTANGRTLLWYLPYKTETEYAVPARVTKIGGFAFERDFSYTTSMTKITLPEGLKSIGMCAFRRNHLLTEITFPSTCTRIDGNAFEQCRSLKEVTLPEGLNQLNWETFFGCSALETVVLPESIRYIYGTACGNCTSLKSINLPEYVQYIDNSAFSNCPNLNAAVVTGSYAEEWCIANGVAYTSVPSSVSALIESEHPYAPNTDQTWEYAAADEDTYAMLLTFSPKTAFSDGDYLTVTEEDGATKEYRWESLRDTSIAVYGSSFTLTLHSDDYNEDYGFMVTEIVEMTEEEFLNYGEFTSYATEDGTLAITGYTGFNPNLTIPSEIDDIAVTVIGNSAFYDDDYLESVVIPEGITKIEGHAFYSCNNLTSVSLPEGLTEIGTYAFAHCNILSRIDFPSTLTSIGEYAFNCCNHLTGITVPEGVTEIGRYTFAECYRLETASLPASLTSIDENAFNNCSKLTIYAPEGSYAYTWAEENDLLPETAIIESEHPYGPDANETWTHTSESADTYAHLVTFSRKTYFGNGDWLEVIDGNGRGRSYSYAELQSQTICLPGSSFTLTLHSNEDEGEYNVGFGFMVTEIAEMTEEEFLNYGEFTSNVLEDGTLEITGYTGFNPNLTIPSEIDDIAVTVIGNNAFNDNDYLESVVIPEGITKIEEDAFYSCSNLTSVFLPEGLTEIGNEAFAHCSLLSRIDFPSTLTSIGEYAFNNCNHLTEVSIPEGVTEIGNRTFVNCSSLTSVSLPEGLTKIGSYAFTWCYNLADVDLPSTLTSIGENAFADCERLKEISIPEGVTELSSSVFTSCESLTSVSLPEGLTGIGTYAFAWCYNLADVSFPSTLTSIGEYAFYQCSNALNEISIPDGVTELKPCTFADCYSLQTVNLHSGLTSIDDSAFSNDSRLSIYAPEGSYAYTWAEERNLLPETAIIESEHPYAPNSDPSWSYTAEGDDVSAILITFSRNTYFSNGDYLIVADAEGKQKTYWWSDLRSKTIAVIGDSFTLTLHSDGSTEEYGFMVTEIAELNEEEFLNYGEFTCNVLEDGTLEITGYTGFKPNLVIPAEIDGTAVTDISSNAFYDNDHMKTLVISEGIKTIGASAFGSCNSLTSIVIPSSVTTIGVNAFWNCHLLTKLTIPEGVTAINSAAFGACYGLQMVNLPASLTCIDEDAFNGVSGFVISAPEGSYARTWAEERGLLIEDAIIESEHPYAPNTDQTWEYVHETDACAMALSFSRMTYFGGNDYLILTDSEGNDTYYYYSDLNSKPVIVPGNSFTLRLVTNAEEEAFGFILTEIVAFESEEELQEYGEFTYRTLDDGTLEITGFTGIRSNLVIPAEIDGAAVTAISSHAFADADHLESVVLPEGLVEIGIYAFDNCVNLTEISLPSTLTDIRNNAFSNCTQLTEITIPEGVTSLDYFVLGNCYKLETAYLPASLTHINDSAFANNYTYYISAPKGSYAYNWAKSENKLPEGLVFQCEHPYAPNTDQTWEYVHDGEAQILAVSFSRMCFFSDGDHLILTDSEGNETCYYYGDLVSGTIAVPGNSFSLRLVTDDSYENYGFRVTQVLAFESEEAMQNYGEFTYNTLEDGTLEVISFNGFRTDLTIPSEINGAAVTRIAEHFAANRASLTSIVIPEGVTSIGEKAFYGCSSLNSVTLPDSLQRIGDYAFASCPMTEIDLPSGVTEIGLFAFAWTSLGQITIPGTVSSISDSAFHNANQLATVRVEEGVSSIDESAFAYCHRLTQLILPASLTSIADTILLDCEYACVAAPEGSFAYQWAETNGLLSVSGVYESEHPYAPNTNQSWTHATEGDDIYAHLITFSRSTIFGGSDHLTITDADGSSQTYWDNGLSGRTVAVMGNSFTLTLYADDSFENYGFAVTEILAVTEEEYQNYGEFTYTMLSNGTLEITGFTGFQSDVTIPSEIDGMAVSAIGYSAFQNNRSTMERAVISEGITAINSAAFYNCYSLVSVTMADSVTSIGPSAFSSCYNISELTLSAGLTQIDAHAFNSCSSLTELVIPEGVTSIGEYAFAYCYALEHVSLPASLTSIPDSLFEGNSSVRITAPEGSAAYDWARANGYLSTDEA